LLLEVVVSIGCGKNLFFGVGWAFSSELAFRELEEVELASTSCGVNCRDDLVLVSIGSILNFRPGVEEDISGQSNNRNVAGSTRSFDGQDPLCIEIDLQNLNPLYPPRKLSQNAR
jgi:hypothetical protein